MEIRIKEAKKPSIAKNIRLVEPFGSDEFYAKLRRFYLKLEALKAKNLVSSNSLKAMSVVDVFKDPKPLPAHVYGNCFLILPADSRSAVDRLLREELIEATVVFNDDRFAEAGIEPGVNYSNDELIGKIFKPRSVRSIDLIDPAIYARLVPGETLTDLFEVPSSIKSALVGTLQAQKEKHNDERLIKDNTLVLTQYSQREKEARKWDARTLAHLIARYACHESRDVNALAAELTDGFTSLFNEKRDVPALLYLKKQLEDGIFKTGSFADMRRLVSQLGEKITIRQKGLTQNKPKKKKKKDSVSAKFSILGYRGWKSHQK